jgi:gas vesicle protein
MNNTGKILLGVAAGAAAGAILGVLFAPDKGSETRDRIKQKGKEFSDGVREKFGKCKEKTDDVKVAVTDVLTGANN